ncbi:MAG: family 43 glycosylhydrolase [Lachnospiraceae bacterium]|nr:family 43 glycosylhydrolase [Lachnospiraceae bacterium]
MKKNISELKAFYPGLSICYADKKYYLVSTSFQYFPGVPLFESADLVKWHQIGHVLTRESQLRVENISRFGEIFSPDICYNKGRFYMVITNDTTHENFYVYTDDIYGEWSDPVTVKQKGMDPSLFFDGDQVYFMSSGTDENGETGIVQCEIDITTGEKLSQSKCIWKEQRGHLLESPHMYRVGDFYYLMATEGCAEYGRKSIYAKSDSACGSFTNASSNPLLTKYNKASSMFQNIGHGDLVQNENGNWYFICLGFRRMHMWWADHILGREVLQIPVVFHEDGWICTENDNIVENVI